MVVARDLGEREMERYWSKNTKFHLCMINTIDLMYSNTTIVNNNPLYA